MILLFAAIGRINHGEVLDIELLLTALPFWTGAPFITSVLCRPAPSAASTRKLNESVVI